MPGTRDYYRHSMGGRSVTASVDAVVVAVKSGIDIDGDGEQVSIEDGETSKGGSDCTSRSQAW